MNNNYPFYSTQHESTLPSTGYSNSYAYPEAIEVSAATTPLINPEQAKNDENTALILLIIGFFFGHLILWLVVYFLYRNSVSEQARKIAKISLFISIVYAIIVAVFVVLPLIIWLIVIIAVGSAAAGGK
jgi:uncharacterized membrane protein